MKLSAIKLNSTKYIWSGYIFCSVIMMGILIQFISTTPTIAAPTGQKNVYLVTKSGEETKVATLNFTKSPSGIDLQTGL